MLSMITNILLMVMVVLPSSDISVTNLEQDQIKSHEIKNILSSTEEFETQISFLNKESSDDTLSNLKQEAQDFNEVQISAIPSISDTNLEESEQQEILHQELNHSSSDETIKATPVSTTSDDESIVDETETVFRGYRQTFYSVTAGEVKVGYGLTYQDDGVKIIDNVMHYYDEEYEWLPIVAVNIDEVLEVGLNERGIPSYYGTILEITYPEGNTQKAIVLDACGACSWDNRIDLWVYDHDYQHDIVGIEYRIVREGFNDDEEQAGY